MNVNIQQALRKRTPIVFVVASAIILGIFCSSQASEPFGFGWWCDFWYEQGAVPTMYQEGASTTTLRGLKFS